MTPADFVHEVAALHAPYLPRLVAVVTDDGERPPTVAEQAAALEMWCDGCNAPAARCRVAHLLALVEDGGAAAGGAVNQPDDAPFCASSPEAQAMPEDEYWAKVFDRPWGEPDPDEAEELVRTRRELPISAGPCPVCGEFEACGYDAEGRALIHALASDS